jgi:ATP-dependent protease ClpP protease subunit
MKRPRFPEGRLMSRDDAKRKEIPEAVLDAIPAPADIMLTGEVNDGLITSFLDQLEKARAKDGDIVVCCTTPGGDAEMVRRITLELERLQAAHKANVYFLGKSTVYSAGVTIMSAFPASHRYLSKDTILLIHGRQLTKTIELDGSIRSAKPKIEALANQIELGIELEEKGFERLIEGSDLTLEEVIAKGIDNWYVTAAEAEQMKLVAGLL